MTLLQLEELCSEEEELAQQRSLTVKCSWCGVIMRLDGTRERSGDVSDLL